MEHFGDSMIDFLKKATARLEELQVQSALGKADMADQLEILKKDAEKRYSLFKSEVSNYLSEKKEEYAHLKAKLEHLQVQLALGKAETMDQLMEQKKNLEATLRDLRAILSKD